MGGDPGSLIRAMMEAYWSDDLREAEAKVEAALNGAFGSGIEGPLRELCLNPARTLEVVSGGRVPREPRDRALVAFAATVLLVGCTEGWRRLDRRFKARVLAPALAACYGVRLAVSNGGGAAGAHRVRVHLLLEEAARRAGEAGLLGELRRLVDSIRAEGALGGGGR